MPTRRDALIGLVALVSGASLAAAPGDDADIYDLALKSIASGLSRRARLAVSDTTIDMSEMWANGDPKFGAPYLHPRTRITYAKPETIEAFLAASSARAPLPASLKKVPELFMVSEAVLRSIGAAQPTDRVIRSNRLRGVEGVRVSGIGVDRELSEALLYVDYFCGSLCGTGTIVCVRRDPAGFWAVKHRDQYMMS